MSPAPGAEPLSAERGCALAHPSDPLFAVLLMLVS
jgi:hypothetical protein